MIYDLGAASSEQVQDRYGSVSYGNSYKTKGQSHPLEKTEAFKKLTKPWITDNKRWLPAPNFTTKVCIIQLLNGDDKLKDEAWKHIKEFVAFSDSKTWEGARNSRFLDKKKGTVQECMWVKNRADSFLLSLIKLSDRYDHCGQDEKNEVIHINHRSHPFYAL
eukprot:gb/GEZN01027417.1/.p1 GENE.gb/GEZN01027417.1/~~gb/GEZN01027417.1/.p1  ORF type:complete len:162 (+),score=26.52 gb/GEZN01027417.1/:1-486(+)